MRKKNRKRAAPRVATLAWCEDFTQVFVVACRLGLTPPPTFKVVLTKVGSTWSARFTTASGEPVPSTVRLRHGPIEREEDATIISDRINLRFVVGGLVAAGNA